MLDVTHRVSIADPHAHLLELKTTFASTGCRRAPLASRGLHARVGPRLVPGSRVRTARRRDRSAKARSLPLACRRIRTNAWEITHDGAHSIEVRYRLYANELTVRTNHVDTTHAYWNGAATYLASELFPALGARVVVDVPADWEIATVLERDGTAPRAYVAKTFDELCDAPFECGKLITRSFSALRRQHAIVAWDNPDARVSIGTSSRPIRPPSSTPRQRSSQAIEAPKTRSPIRATCFSGTSAREGAVGSSTATARR